MYRHIFTGPATALEPGAIASGPLPIGIAHGLKRTTPRTIAYIAVQVSSFDLRYTSIHAGTNCFHHEVRFMLSNIDRWATNLKDGHFLYEEFYNNIVDLFESKPGPNSQWAKETLEWFDRYVERFFVLPIHPSDPCQLSGRCSTLIQLPPATRIDWLLIMGRNRTSSS